MQRRRFKSREGGPGRIIVGVDTSAGAAEALRWAVREGALRGWSVTALMVWNYLDQHHPVPGSGFEPFYGEPTARAALEAAVVRAVGAGTARGVQQEVVCDLVVPGLAGRSGQADLLVLGTRGPGRFRSLVGSVSQGCLRRAPCPVAVVGRAMDVRPAGRAQRIVVAVDRSPGALQALRLAHDEARLRGATVKLVQVGRRWTRRWRTAGGVEAVLQAARDAELVVMGAREGEGFWGRLLHRAGQQVARHAPCPVVLVPAAARA
jgi:nucleotide-binding universal stress UspA family protein